MFQLKMTFTAFTATFLRPQGEGNINAVPSMEKKMLCVCVCAVDIKFLCLHVLLDVVYMSKKHESGVSENGVYPPMWPIQ